MPWQFTIVWVVGMTVMTMVGTYIIRRWRDDYGYTALLVILTSYLIVNTVLARRLVLVHVFGLELTLLSGTIVWPFTSQIVDMINEVYGAKKSYIAAALGYLGRVIFLMVTFGAAFLSPVWEAGQEAFWQGYFSQAWRIVLAGAISYGMVQFFNIYVFDKAKRKTMPTETTLWKTIKGGFIRSWGGDFFGDLLDGPVFYILAFTGSMPWETVWALTLSATGTKMLINQIDLPFYALFRILLGNKVRKDY